MLKVNLQQEFDESLTCSRMHKHKILCVQQLTDVGHDVAVSQHHALGQAGGAR